MRQMLILFLIIIAGLPTMSFAQANRKTAAKPQTAQSKRSVAAPNSSPQQKAKEVTVVLSSTSANEAYSPSRGRFSIADPAINVLNQRAGGNNVPVSSSGIVGMPKGTYGIANGKILLRPTTATSSGTAYGSGAVGTGTTLMGVGTGENTPGINGKNPYAGPWLWGTKPSTLLPSSGTAKKKPADTKQ
ncbi:MAG TPA: hypothetical protein VFT06_16650 [Flavisolibacter sp.]|nr:hypothetical protein [Flavisolibacter sp.]